MKFVGDAAGSEEFVERLRSDVKTVVVFGAAIEIDVHAHGSRAIADDGEWAVALPEGRIERVTESAAQGERDRVLLSAGHLDSRQLGNQRGAVRADRAK